MRQGTGYESIAASQKIADFAAPLYQIRKQTSPAGLGAGVVFRGFDYAWTLMKFLKCVFAIRVKD